MAHYTIGAVDGLIFAPLVTNVNKLRIDTPRKAIGIGLLFGVVVYFVVFLPVSLLGFAPVTTTMMGPAAASMLPMVEGLAVVEHLLFGLIVGLSLFAGLRSQIRGGGPTLSVSKGGSLPSAPPKD